ncbi:MAG: succinate dehydrogenase assembly factor 2 [Devosiaceae bacterium]|nr:succinate dehydrogenase assembly factor 2 [Devosiaceae bacterium]
MEQKTSKNNNRIKRMLYRCWHRGTQEMDLILGHFANAKLDGYNEVELDRFEELMDEQDTDLLKWILGQEPVPDNIDADFIKQLRDFQLLRNSKS